MHWGLISGLHCGQLYTCGLLFSKRLALINKCPHSSLHLVVIVQFYSNLALYDVLVVIHNFALSGAFNEFLPPNNV